MLGCKVHRECLCVLGPGVGFELLMVSIHLTFKIENELIISEVMCDDLVTLFRLQLFYYSTAIQKLYFILKVLNFEF